MKVNFWERLRLLTVLHVNSVWMSSGYYLSSGCHLIIYNLLICLLFLVVDSVLQDAPWKSWFKQGYLFYMWRQVQELLSNPGILLSSSSTLFTPLSSSCLPASFLLLEHSLKKHFQIFLRGRTKSALLLGKGFKFILWLGGCFERYPPLCLFFS